MKGRFIRQSHDAGRAFDYVYDYKDLPREISFLSHRDEFNSPYVYVGNMPTLRLIRMEQKSKLLMRIMDFMHTQLMVELMGI